MNGGMRHVPPLARFAHPMGERLAAENRSTATLEKVPLAPLGPNGFPYAGEEREEQHTVNTVHLADGQRVALCGLKRAWRVVGFVVSPGNLPVGEGSILQARLRVIVAGGLNALSDQMWTIGPGSPVFFYGLEVAARCDLIVTNASGVAVRNVAGAIWGMNEGL